MKTKLLALAGLALPVAAIAFYEVQASGPRASTPTVAEKQVDQELDEIPPAQAEAIVAQHDPAPETTAPVTPVTTAPNGAAVTIDPLDELRADLAAEDRATRIEAVEKAWRAGRTDALPILQKTDLAKDPDAAPTIIRAIAELGAKGTPRERDEAASTLASWLDTERKRESTDATGNVSMLVEALGDTGSRDAVAPLAHALDTNQLPLYIETLAVQQLGALGDGSAKPAISRFAARVALLTPDEGVDAELRNEAAAAADDALRRL